VVISGKGGTGKTTIVGCFVALSGNCVVVDCDVDAPNLHLILKPRILVSGKFSASRKARIDREKCTGCGKCVRHCKFNTIFQVSREKMTKYDVEMLSCEGCGLCAMVCPVDAILMLPHPSGRWYVSETRYGKFIHALLGAGEENSGKLVALIKQKAMDIAKESDANFIIVDGPPGIGCPVISSLSGADIALIVTEPTLSGLSDLKRAVSLTRGFNLKMHVCINKADINEDVCENIGKFCSKTGVDIIGRIPFDDSVPISLAQQKTLFEIPYSKSKTEIIKMWNALK
jgi:MinD superfamily P-loop ATPase